MIEAAKAKLAGEADRLKALLEQSRVRLAPLGDPFGTDLGLHRWLEEDREEAYSDWLEWVVKQIKSPAEVFRLFGLEPPAAISKCQEFEAKRELCIPRGHEGREGRLDLVIRFADLAILVVEVKKGDADEADTSKQSGYAEWLKDESYTEKHSVLVAADAEATAYEGFEFRSWGTLSIEMRRLAVGMCKDNRVMTAAMVLAFVAAVEQNLLGFSAAVVKAVCEGKTLLFNTAVVDHLKEFVMPVEV
jgi:hypothetical protein